MSESEPIPVFDEAACLYAQYLPIVEEMEQAFLLSVEKFWSNVRQTIDKRSEPLKINDEDKKHWRVWWLQKTNNGPEKGPYLWFYHRKAQIITPGEVEFTVNIVPDPKRLRPEIEKALLALELPQYCSRKRKAAEGMIATYLVSYGKSAQPVEDVAEVLIPILKCIESFNG